MQKLIGQTHIVQAIFPQAGGALNGDYISLKNYGGVSIIIMVDVTAAATDSSITLRQATNVSDGSGKALEFDTMWKNLDTETLDALTKTVVASDTFEAGGVTKSTLYVIEVKAEDLDVANGFDCLRVQMGAIATANVCVLYVLHTPRYRDQIPTNFSAVSD